MPPRSLCPEKLPAPAVEDPDAAQEGCGEQAVPSTGRIPSECLPVTVHKLFLYKAVGVSSLMGMSSW